MPADEIIQKKKEYFFPNTMHFYSKPPHIIKGEGKYLFDDDGRRYLDFFAGVTVVNCGHCNPEITEKICEQVKRLQHASIIYLTQPMVLLAERLAKILPGDIRQMFFCNSGSEANDGALSLARMKTGKRGFLAFKGGLHGRTTLTLSVTGIDMWRIDPFLDDEPVWFAESFAAGEDSPQQKADDSLRSVENILNAHGNQIAACIVEPVQGNGGINIPPKDFFIRLKKLLEAHNVLLILDEIQTGFARTGYMFASEYFGIVPDIISFAKALGNGTPIAAFAARPDTAAALNKPSSSTLGGNPVSMTAGLAVLDFIEKNNLCEKSKELGAYFLEKLKAVEKNHAGLIENARGLGLMLGVSMKDPSHVDIVLEKMKDGGVIIGKNGINREVLVFQPPLIIDKDDIDAVCALLEETLASLR
ncbi:MAG: aspartate aminotransferase family protein [Spirochaetia bacterium]|jgi:4-aminobutyrate aminotransferase|nr:aspartate aminotransferase family protein [Spirochaetia bacterium]